MEKMTISRKKNISYTYKPSPNTTKNIRSMNVKASYIIEIKYPLYDYVRKDN